MNRPPPPQAFRRTPGIHSFLLWSTLILVTLMTGSPLERSQPTLSLTIKALGYLIVLGAILYGLVRGRAKGQLTLSAINGSYGSTTLIPLGLYFGGMLIGAVRGPQTGYSLWQTFSDGVVFLFGFTYFGFLVEDLQGRLKGFLEIITIWTALVALPSILVWIGNVADWWRINYILWEPWDAALHLMNGPFNHPNHMAYFLMVGSLSGAALGIGRKTGWRWNWLVLGLVLGLLEVFTFGRGAILGTLFGWLGILAIRKRRLAFTLGILSTLVALYFVGAGFGVLPTPQFVPKIGFSDRAELWGGAVDHLREVGPLGLGAGQAQGGLEQSPHNYWLEQLQEGGVISVIGVATWILLPILKLRESRLEPPIAWSLVSMMAALMIHGIFWGQFLIGLRYLTFVYICLWTALGTLGREKTLQHRQSGSAALED